VRGQVGSEKTPTVKKKKKTRLGAGSGFREFEQKRIAKATMHGGGWCGAHAPALAAGKNFTGNWKKQEKKKPSLRQKGIT